MTYRPAYCTQPTVPDCWHCSLCNYGRDCCNRSIAQRDAGATTSEAKRRSSRENGKLGGRPRTAR